MDKKRIEVEEDELKTHDPNFWSEAKQAEIMLRSIRDKKAWLLKFDDLNSKFEDLNVLMEFNEMGEATPEDLDSQALVVERAMSSLEFMRMLGRDEDRMGALMTINPGAGGTESQDWAAMLMRMYQRYGERNNYKVNVVDFQDGETAGIKSVSIEFEGEFAFGYLKSENGVHRLVRLSPFDSANRRHTSFASVFVYPLVDDSIEIEINPADISWDTFRSSGPGGQHVNKTESAVRLKHEPSGIIVECQEGRSQLKNREKAMQMLKSRLFQQELEKKQAARQEIEDSKLKIEWGSQIRSYVMHPYKMVKDHRTNFETSNVQGVMDGEIDDFMREYLLFANK